MIEPRVAVVGAGAWGTTLAVILGKVEPVLLLAHDAEAAERIDAARENERRLPGDRPASERHRTATPPTCASAADLVIFAIPSAHLRATVERIAPNVAASADLLSVVKGLEPGSLLRMTEVIASAGGFAVRRLAALSGPNLAGEIARGLPASAVVAAVDPELADRIVERLGRREFRLYVNSDVLGRRAVRRAEERRGDRCGRGRRTRLRRQRQGRSDDPRPGRDEPARHRGGGEPADVRRPGRDRRRDRDVRLDLSRNHRLGVELARGRTWAEIETALPGVAEGAYTVDAALALAARHGVEMPIAQEVHNALFEGKSVQRCLIDLLSRESKDELADADAWAERLRS